MDSLLSLGMDIRAAEKVASSKLPILETRLLLSHALGLSRIELITQSETVLSSEQLQCCNDLFYRRMQGEPIAYILGEREFFGRMFAVSPAVLIPRPDTELLVELALENIPQHGNVLDLGTGSGAIAISIAAERPDCQLLACDISQEALDVAQKNAQTLVANKNISFIQSDWYTQIPPQSFDCIVSNPPYIVKEDVHLNQGDLRFEPINALTDHDDGLSAYRNIINGAPNFLKKGGMLLFEHGYNQFEAVQKLLLDHGFIEVQSWQDLAGIWRVTGGRLN
jgi:release factor glutamine methyltransferase